MENTIWIKSLRLVYSVLLTIGIITLLTAIISLLDEPLAFNIWLCCVGVYIILALYYYRRRRIWGWILTVSAILFLILGNVLFSFEIKYHTLILPLWILLSIFLIFSLLVLFSASVRQFYKVRTKHIIYSLILFIFLEASLALL